MDINAGVMNYQLSNIIGEKLRSLKFPKTSAHDKVTFLVYLMKAKG